MLFTLKIHRVDIGKMTWSFITRGELHAHMELFLSW